MESPVPYYTPGPKNVVLRRRHADFEEVVDEEGEYAGVYEARFTLEPDEVIMLLDPHGIGAVVIYTVEET